MAQHIEIRHAPQKILQKIADRLAKECAKMSVNTTSMKWQYLGEQEGCKVFLTNRYVGKGFVWGSERADFEVHVRGQMIEHIFLVA